MNVFQTTQICIYVAFQATLERIGLASFPGLLCFTFCLHLQYYIGAEEQWKMGKAWGDLSCEQRQVDAKVDTIVT